MAKDDPPRKGIFALQVLQEILAGNTAVELGATSTLLILAVVAVQDRLRRVGTPVGIHNSELMRAIGVANWKTLDDARRRAVSSGWVSYQPTHRDRGFYTAHLPNPDMHKSHINAYIKAHAIPSNKPDSLHSYDFNPSPPPSSPEGAEVKEQQTPKKKSRPPPTAEDANLAEFIRQVIHDMQPSRKPPKLAQWANDIRLMREADKRTPDEIRQVFLWANADDFWRKNILSPAKLREKFDDLTLRMQKPRKGPQQAATTQQPQATPIDPKNKYDV